MPQMTQAGINQLESDEGCVLTAYPDPLSGADPWTIGFGSTGPGIVQGTVWTMQQATTAMMNTLTANAAQLDQLIPWWNNLDSNRSDALQNQCYNVGVSGLMQFKMMLAGLQSENWQEAHDQALDSLWAQQVGQRAVRIANTYLTGAVRGGAIR